MGASPQIVSVSRAVPRNRVEQKVLLEALRGAWAGQHFNVGRIEQLHRSVKVGARHLALPIEEYREIDGFQKANDAWIQVALDMGGDVVAQALRKAELKPEDVDHCFSVTVTGIAAPSIEARIANRLGLNEQMKRTPIFGLGCSAGVAGIARAADYLRAYPDEVAVLLSVELCSLTLQKKDISITNIIASGLFGDGAAAVVLKGGDRPGLGPRVVSSRSIRYPDTERIMGWDVVDSGFKVVLSTQVPQLVAERLGKNVDDFLGELGLRRADIRHWLCHTGGPKVIEAVETALALPGGALRRSWESLEQFGNLSSSSVLFVLEEFLRTGDAREGDYGLMIAMGPGFGCELVLLQW